jgi:predicted permease
MGAPLINGRDFDMGDGLDPPAVVIINQALADKFFPGENPIGMRVAFDRSPDADSVWREIVGVVGNIRREALSLEEKPSFYAPVLQDTSRQVHILVRAEKDSLVLVEALRERVRALDPALPIFDVTTLEAVVTASLAQERFLLALLALAGVIALALAGVGIFGVVLYSTTRRLREIGIRIALGARRKSVVVLVVRSGLGPVLVGIIVGALASGILARVMSNLLFEVEPTDPPTFVGVVGLLLLAALVACALPASRATRIDAASVLRTE